MTQPTNNFKPVILDGEKCNGCVACMKRCPTEAIRVRNGKAVIRYERCIGCGECVKACPTNAKRECYDSLETIKDYEYTVCVVSSTLYGQFNRITDANLVLNALKNLGFNDVYEVASGAEIVSEATKQFLKNSNSVKPVISSCCPCVNSLILMRYAHLIPNLSPFKQSEIVTAKLALDEAVKKTGLKRSKIGIFVITQCAAKVTELNTAPAKKYIDKVLSVKEIYFSLLSELGKIGDGSVAKIAKAGRQGLSWGCSSGGAAGLGIDNYLCADGLENVIEVLNELERDKLRGIDFIELFSCPSGCVGGSMNVENPFVARVRMRQIRKNTPEKQIKIANPVEYMRAEPYVSKHVYRLSNDRKEALKLTMQAKEICDGLPGLNCGACGSPRCEALAEDIAKGEQGIGCIVMGKK